MTELFKLLGNIVGFVAFTDALRFVINSIGNDKCFGNSFSKTLVYLIWAVGTFAITYFIWRS